MTATATASTATSSSSAWPAGRKTIDRATRSSIGTALRTGRRLAPDAASHSSVRTAATRRVSKRAYAEARERVSTVNADLQENVAGLRVAQAHRRERLAARRFAQRSDAYRRSRLRAQLYISLYFPFVAFLSEVALAAVVGVGAARVAEGRLTAGVLVAGLVLHALGDLG